MTTVTIECPNCHRTYNVDERFLGKKVVCSNSTCGTKFVAPPRQPPAVATTFEKGSDPTVPQDRPLPPSRIARDPKSGPRAGARGTPIMRSDTKNHRSRMIVLAVLASVPGVLLIVGLIFYWNGTSHTPTTTTAPISSVKDISDVDPEFAKYRKSIIRALMFTHLAVQSVKGRLDTNDKFVRTSASMAHENLTMARNAVGAPPKSLKTGEQIEGYLDAILSDFQRAITLIEEPTSPGKFANVADIIAGLQTIDGRGVPEAIAQSLDDVTHSADAIARELGLSFEEAHRSDLFAETALNFLAAIRAAATKLRALPVDPPQSDLLLSVVSSTSITREWVGVNAMPADMPDRDRIASGLALAHAETVKAVRAHEASYNFLKKLTHDDQVALRTFSDKALDDALAIVESLEPVIMKSRSR
jgi:hypothetical protein